MTSYYKTRLLLVFATFLFSACALQSLQSQNLNLPDNSNWDPDFKKFFQVTNNMQNPKDSKKVPYLLLISIDSYRFDYNQIHSAPHLSEIAKNSVSAESLIPTYPSKTFSSHFSIITGKYPEENGIVSNEFYDPSEQIKFSTKTYQNTKTNWFLSEPFWIRIQNAGIISANVNGWVGSEVDYHGQKPLFFSSFSNSNTPEIISQNIVKLINLPESIRPHFIVAYFPQVDLAGHFFGPESKQVHEQILKVDTEIEKIKSAIKESNLDFNIMIVSDHGMQEVSKKDYILIDPSIDLTDFIITGQGPELQLYLKNKNKISSEKADQIIEKTYKKIQTQAQHFEIYKHHQIPESLHYKNSSRIGDLVIIPESPYLVFTKEFLEANPQNPGNHGWDAQKYPNMRGVFMAEGPLFKSNTHLASFSSLQIYPLLERIFNLDASSNNKNLESLKALKSGE